MKKILYNIILCVFLYSITSCNFITKLKIYYNIKYWQNKSLIIPNNLDVKVQGKNSYSTLSQFSNYRILNYIDTSTCISCELKLREWQLLKNEIDSLNIKVDIVFVVWSQNYDNLEKLQKINKCIIPCIYDYQNEIALINNFSAQSDFHTFLLDSFNRVLLIGNPITNKQIRKLYIKKISQ